MRHQHKFFHAVIAGLGATAAAGMIDAQPLTWSTIANNATVMPDTSVTFNSFNQPAVNTSGIVIFRARSKGGSSEPVHGIYQLQPNPNPKLPPLLVKITARGEPVPQPNNALYNGALASFNEYPSTPRIDALSPMIATRGQSQPVYEYQIGVDPATGSPLTTKIGTSGIYTNPGGVLVTGASLLGAVTTYPTTALTFPQYSVPGAPAGTRFDQFPGGPAATNGTIITFKGNYTDPSDGVGKTGVYFRDVAASAGLAPVQVVANTGTVIPNPPGAPLATFGSTAPPSAANGYMVFTGLDVEAAPTRGGIYRAPLASTPSLQTLAGIGDQVPGEAAGTGFIAFGEGLSISTDARFASFWGAWGSETFSKTLYCSSDGNKDVLAYCNAQYPNGYTVAIPVHQGIFVADAQTGKLYAIAKTQADGYTDFMYWVFSGHGPGTGGSGDPSMEPPRWRSSAFSALSGGPGIEPQIAFKAAKSGNDGIYLRKGRSPGASLVTVVETLYTAGQAIDPQAPANSIVTAVGVERDGFRGTHLTVAVSMLFEDPVTPLGWAGLYITEVPLLPPQPDNAGVTLASSLNPSTVGASVTFTATVVGNAPTGTVTFKDDGTAIAGCSAQPVTKSDGTATCTTKALPQGSHSITATYNGDAGNGSTTSAPLVQVVNAGGGLATTTSLVSSLNPAALGDTITFSATVADASYPTGTVAFMDGASPIAGCGAKAVVTSKSTGAAACTTSGLTPGQHSITAVYSGDAANLGSSSPPVLQTIQGGTGAVTTTTLASSLNPSVVGASVTFTATITGGTAPTGAVDFRDGATSITGCSAQPVSSTKAGVTATCTTKVLSAGVHSITAAYGGDAANLPSTSAPLTQTVTGSGPTPTTTIVVSSQPVASAGAPVTFTATVTGNAPTGTVDFRDGAASIASCSAQPVASGQAQCTTSSLAVGKHAISAAYGGDIANLPSVSAAIPQLIQ
jgi:hypothetical protein